MQAGEAGKQAHALTVEFNKLAERVDAASDNVRDIKAQIANCDKDEEERQRKLGVERQMQGGMLAQLEAMADAPAGYDEAQDTALKVRPLVLGRSCFFLPVARMCDATVRCGVDACVCTRRVCAAGVSATSSLARLSVCSYCLGQVHNAMRFCRAGDAPVSAPTFLKGAARGHAGAEAGAPAGATGGHAGQDGEPAGPAAPAREPQARRARAGAARGRRGSPPPGARLQIGLCACLIQSFTRSSRLVLRAACRRIPSSCGQCVHC